MPVTVSGMIEAEVMIGQMDMTTKKRVSKVLWAKAVEIQLLAQKMAPRDKGFLEESIKVFPERPDGPAPRNDAGQFIRKEFYVYVDMEMDIPDRPGKKIGDYAYIMHEHLEPIGPMRLGPESRDKQSGQSEQVGGAFLTRAMEEVTGGLLEEISADLLGDFGL